MIEENIDCRKHRKSTHLASADLDVLTLEKKSLIFHIEKVWYETGVNVSGNKTDGYFCKLKEHEKNLVLNSTNRIILASFARTNGFEAEECYNIGNWKGMAIELYVDRSVKMMGKTVDGIRIKTKQPIVELPKLVKGSKDWDNVLTAMKNGFTIDKIEVKFQITDKLKKELNAGI